MSGCVYYNTRPKTRHISISTAGYKSFRHRNWPLGFEIGLIPDCNSRLELEYLFHQDAGIGVLKSPDIIGLNDPAHKWKAVRYGCAFRLLHQGKTRQYIIILSEELHVKHTWSHPNLALSCCECVQYKDHIICLPHEISRGGSRR